MLLPSTNFILNNIFDYLYQRTLIIPQLRLWYQGKAIKTEEKFMAFTINKICCDLNNQNPSITSNPGELDNIALGDIIMLLPDFNAKV